MGIASKSPKTTVTNVSPAKDINCKYCNLRFSTAVWLKKHIDRCHAKQAVAKVAAKSETPVNILKYKQQLENIQQTLDRKNDKQNRKRAKVSPKKQLLREQLKQQLAAQQKLLQVQQEIFEKTTKAQQDIFNLIAKLGDSDNDDVNNTEDDEEENDDDEEEEVGTSRVINAGGLKFENKLDQSEVFIEDPGVSELIVGDTINETYEYYPTENYELEEQYITDADGNITVIKGGAGAASAGTSSDAAQQIAHPERSLRVFVQSQDGEDVEYEIDLEDDGIGGGGGGDPTSGGSYQFTENGIDFEVIGQDKNSMHCRIVSNDEAIVEEIEYVEVQNEEEDDQEQQKERKVPIKLEVDNLQKIAQKHFKWQQQSLTGKNSKADTSTTVTEESEETSAEAKVLNTTIHKSEKQTNEYISKVVQNAVPTEDNKFECPICMELVSNRYSLGPHILRLHSKQKSKICQYCDRSFTCTGDLTR